MRPALRCADSSLPHAWGGMKESHRVCPLSPPTLPPTGQGGKAFGQRSKGPRDSPGSPPEGPKSPSSMEGHCRTEGGGRRAQQRGCPKLSSRPLQRRPARHPRTLRGGLQSLPRRPAHGPTHRSRSPRGRPERPAPAAGAGRAPGASWRGTYRAPRGGRRTRGRRPRAVGARAVPGAGFPPLAPPIGAGWGRGRGVGASAPPTPGAALRGTQPGCPEHRARLSAGHPSCRGIADTRLTRGLATATRRGKVGALSHA